MTDQEKLQALVEAGLTPAALPPRQNAIVMYNFPDKLPGQYRTGHVNLTNTDKALPSAQEVPLRMHA